MVDRPSDPESVRAWVERWGRVGPLLQDIKTRDAMDLGTIGSIQALSGAFRAGLREHPPEPTSGLVEQQRWLARLPR
jgi:hypothetical protein